jgi:methionine-rich copper-binding protein CopC
MRRVISRLRKAVLSAMPRVQRPVIRACCEELEPRRLLAATLTIAQENALPGTPQSTWFVSGTGDTTIQGFTTDISVDQGGTVSFKIDDTAVAPYQINIYRIGYYGGDGAALKATITSSQTLKVDQPAPIEDPTTGEIDAGNWSVTATWAVPSNATSGVYDAVVQRTDTGGKFSILFVVRDDASTSQIMYQTADATWQAYNEWGGNSLYVGTGPGGGSQPGRAFAVSYNRPVTDEDVLGGYGQTNYFWYGEYPLVRFMEENGYDVTYSTDVDADRFGSLIQNHKVWIDAGHDEYWSGNERANLQAAANAGVDLMFLTGNEVYWKTEYDPSIDGTDTPDRTLTCYKDSIANALINPSGVWTGLWSDTRFVPASQDVMPGNALSGTEFTINRGPNDDGESITVPGTDALERIWRDTAVASLSPTATLSLGDATLGYESDSDVDNGYRPAGEIDVSATLDQATQEIDQFNHETYPATVTQDMTEYRNPISGALVFSAGTVQWSWGLDNDHVGTDVNGNVPPIDKNMQQATINILADMGVAATTLMSGLVQTTASTDKTAPTSTLTVPGGNLINEQGGYATVTGSSTDSGGGVVAGVEVSVDGGKTWNPVTSMSADATTVTWSYTWSVGTATTAAVQVRATDDSLNTEKPKAAVNLSLSSSGQLYIFSPTAVPQVANSGDANAIEVGVNFSTDVPGTILGIRFYKSTANTGTHIGDLWSSTGTLLATATFTGETASGWQQVMFSTPVSIQPGVTYTASYHTNTGDYAADAGYFEQFPAQNGTISANADETDVDSEDSGPANGVYAYGSASTFPTQTYQSTNYWVDVVFAPSKTAVAPQVIAETPAPGSTGVALSPSITVQFNEAVNPNSISMQLTNQTNSAVPATLSYNSATNTATLTPINPLAGSELYTVTVESASDTSGDLLPSPVSWTFTTVPGFTSSPISIFSATSVPGTITTNAAGAIEVGVNFESQVAGTITGIRFYKGPSNTGTHIGNLWTGDGTLIESATFTNETASGWQQVNFATPVQIQANVIYVASYHTNTGFYSSDAEYFATTGVANGPLEALSDSAADGNGVYLNTANSAFPVNSLNATNFWVDVVFTPGSGLSVTGVNPANGSTGVNPANPVVVTFNQALNAATVTSATVQLLDSNNNPVTATLTYNSTADSVTITPSSSLLTNTNYTVQVIGGSSGVQAASGGATLGSTFSSTFTTVSNTPPTVTATSPLNGATGILPNAPVTVTFSEAMNASSITATTIQLVDPSDNVVASSVTYNSSTNTATLTPTNSLSPGLTYSVQVLGGASGVQSAVLDVPMAATYLSTFTTAAVASDSIFSAATTPANVDENDTQSVELGMKFESSVPGTITGVRFYKGPTNVGSHVGNLWSSTGTLLATVTFTNETASGWQQANFANPVTIQANTEYVISYHTAGFYSGDTNYFATSGVTTGPLSAYSNSVTGGNGVFTYGATSAFPTSTFESTNYYVDVVFTPALGPPVVTNVTPANGSIGVPTSGPFTVTFNEALDSTTVTSSTIQLLNSSNVAVAASVTYNAATNSVTVTPTNALTAGASYTLEVIGGSNGVKSSGSDVALAANFTSTFTTAAAAASSVTIFSDSAEPSIVTVDDPQAVELGVAFETSLPGQITGVRFYKGPLNTGTHIGNLWSVQDDGFTLLATATFTNETASGWQTVTFSSPVTIAAGETYIASYHTNVGYYSANPGYFATTGVTNGPLTALPTNELDDPGGNGLYAYGADQFPLHTTNATNYWVDVLFSPTSTAPPTVSTVVPADDATGVSTTSSVTVSFSEALDPTTVTASTIELLTPGNTLVPATVTYNATTESAVLTPTSALAAGTTYTVQIVGGTSGVKSANGDVPMTSTFTTNFTTSPAVNNTVSIFAASAVPSTVTVNDPSSIELGMEFESSVSGTISGVRFYKGPQNTGTHVGNLWTSTGTLLASVTFTGESASGWQQANFSTPVTIQANTVYVVSYHTTSGFYSENTAYFTSNITSGPLTALANGGSVSNGLFLDSASSAFPTSSASGTNYWVDVVFNPTTTGPSVVGESPASGATLISTSTTISATFNEAVTASSIVFSLKSSGGATVAATLSYNAATDTAVLTPTSALTANTTYTATVSAATDAVGNSLTAPVSWSFTTVPTGGLTVFAASSVPTDITDPDTNAVELGMKFESSVAGLVTGVRFYKGTTNTGTHIGNLWSSTGTLLATVTFTGETGSGWQQANFSTPVAIQANTEYVISYHTNGGHYSADSEYFATSAITNGPLSAYANSVTGGNGVYTYSASSAFPSSTYQATNYWVDVVFTPNAAVIPTVTAETPASGASGVATSSTVTATFNEAVTSSSIVFTLKDSLGNTVATTFAYNTTTNVATWTPTAALKTGMTYTATISGATDANKNVMAAPIAWSFTTVAPAVPAVTAETPASGATGVATSSTITATFNQAVTSGSIVFTLTPAGGSAVATTLSYNTTTNVATWTPTALLKGGTTYTASVSGATNSGGTAMTSPFTWTFTTAAPVIPTVTAETPVSGATNIATSSTVTATFNEAVTSGSIVFTLTPSGGSAVATTLSYNSTTNVATWTPTALLKGGTTYTASVSGATDSSGDVMASPFTWTFTTAAPVIPTVTAETPASNATNVATNSTVTATFNEAVTSGSIVFTLTPAGGSAVATTLSYNSTTNVATWTPTALLKAGTTYTASISGATDSSGDVMASPFTWTFTTVPPVIPTVTAETPASGATNVATNSTVTATFNEAVTSGSIVFTLTPAGGSAVATTLSYNSTTNVATWTPTALVKAGTTYTASISGATDSSGDVMASPVTWTFTTVPAVIPTVTAETPVSGATKVATSSTVTATFNEAVTSGSIVFTLTPSGGSAVATTLSYNSTTNVATWTPTAALKAGTTYTASVSGATDASGDVMASPFTWTFTTASIIPAVTAETPASGATAVETSTKITATFNEAVTSSSIVFTLKTSGGTTVATTLSYSSSTNTATWTPTAALAAGTTYTATISGATDASGDVMSAPFSWSFTTVPAAGLTLFSSTTVPKTVTDSDPNAVELGMKFETSVAGNVTGVRFYKGSKNTGTHIGNLWSSTGTLLATVTFSGETASGWQQANFSKPVAISANTEYIISYHTNVGQYSGDTQYFATAGVTNGPLSAYSNSVSGGNGVYTYGKTSAFPTSTYEATNYYVDVVFTPTGTAPAVTAVTPSAGATGVATNTTITATFNEAITSSTLVFTLTPAGGSPVTATLSYNSTTNTATWTPSSALQAGVVYTATISGATDASGDVMASAFSWTFTV